MGCDSFSSTKINLMMLPNCCNEYSVLISQFYTKQLVQKSLCLRVAYFLTSWIVLNIIKNIFTFRPISRIVLKWRIPNHNGVTLYAAYTYWQYRACWCWGDIRSQSINRYGIETRKPDYSLSSTKEFKQYLPLVNQQTQANNQPWYIRWIPLCLK